jgi:hypothetical protein
VPSLHLGPALIVETHEEHQPVFHHAMQPLTLGLGLEARAMQTPFVPGGVMLNWIHGCSPCVADTAQSPSIRVSKGLEIDEIEMTWSHPMTGVPAEAVE